MKRAMLLAGVISMLSFAVVFAEDKQSGNEPNQKPELNQNLAAGGTSASQEKTGEVEQMRERMEQRRRQTLQQRAMDMNSTAQRRGRGDVNMADANVVQNRKEVIAQLISKQESGYRDRLARLGRIRELAKEQGDVNTVEKVDNLITQDQQFHQEKMKRMSRWQEMMDRDKGHLPPSSGEKLRRVEKVKEATIPDANKSTSQPPLVKRP